MSSWRDGPPPWVLVCGGFHTRGAMDRLNMALADHLLATGRDVHLVGHDIDTCFGVRRGAHVHHVPRLGAVAAGELLLGRIGRRVAKHVRTGAPGARVIVNGGNCAESDVNWVHAVHHAWPQPTGSLPLGRGMTERLQRGWFRRRERQALSVARVVIANSEKTRRDLVDALGLLRERIHVVHPGVDPAWRPASHDERTEARARLGITSPAMLFVGALGADDNKGLGPLLAAWRALCARPSWTGTLLVAGRGPLLAHWLRQTASAGLSARVRFLEFVHDLKSLFAASDLLISASRYEAYGLGIAEALCRGVPAIVPENAGIAEQLGTDYAGLLVRGPVGATTLEDALRRWAEDPERWCRVAAQTGARLRQYTLDDMAAAIVTVADR